MNTTFVRLVSRQIAWLSVVFLLGLPATAQTMRLVSVKVHLNGDVVPPLYDEDGFLDPGESLEVSGLCGFASDFVSPLHTVFITTCQGDDLSFHILYPDLYRTSPYGQVSIDHWEVNSANVGSSSLIFHTVTGNVDIDVFLTQTVSEINRDPISARWNPDAGRRSDGEVTWGPAFLTAKSLVSDVTSEVFPALPYSGEAFEKQVDLAVKGRGLDFVFSRVHRSGDPDGGGEYFGGSWTHSLDIQLESPEVGSGTSNPVSLRMGNGSSAIFLQKYVASPSRYYYAEGWDAELKLTQSGSTFTYVLRFGDGVAWTFESFPTEDLAGISLPLTSIEDRFGNTMTFAYDGSDRLETITDTLGREYTLAYSGDTIESLTEEDGLGRVVSYSYDAGKLDTVTYPATTDFPSGSIIDYDYNDDGRLEGVTDPRGNAILTNGYNGDGALTSQQLGEGTESRTVTYEYSGLVVKDDEHAVRITDAAGHVTDHYFNSRNQLFRLNRHATDGGDGFTTLIEWEEHAFSSGVTVSDDLPALVTLPDGLILDFDYEGPGSGNSAYKYRMNLRKQTRIGADGRTVEELFGRKAIDGGVSYWDARFGESFFTCHTVRAPGQVPLSGTFYTYSSDGLATLDGIDYLGIAPYAGDPFDHCDLPDMESFSMLSGVDPWTFSLLDAAEELYENTLQLFMVSESMYDPESFLLTESGFDGGSMLMSTASEDHHESFGYNDYGQLTEHLHPDNDEDGDPGDKVRRKDTYTYLNGYVRVHTVDAGGEGIATTYTSDAVGRVTHVLDPKSNATDIAYDSLDQVTQIQGPELAAASDERPTTTFSYDANGNLLRSRSYWFDETGTLIPVTGETDPDAYLATEYTYDTRNRPTAIAREKGGGTTISETQYDGNGNVILERSPLAVQAIEANNVIAYEYNERDLPIRIERGGELITRMDYDAAGRVIRTIEGYGTAEARESNFVYDGLGFPKETTDAAGLNIRYTRDALGRATKTEALDGTAVLTHTLHRYELPGRLTRIDRMQKDESGANTASTNGQLSTVLAYTDAGMLRTRENEEVLTQYAYDSVMRSEQVIFPEGNIQEFAYDENGNVTVATERARNTQDETQTAFLNRYAYDELDRLIASGSDDGDGDSNDAKTTTYAYDSLGHLVEEVDPRGNVTEHAYDALGRLTSTTHGAGVIDAVIAYGYDDNNRLTTTTDPNGNVTQQAYDAFNRPTKTTYADGQVERLAYDAINNPVEHIAPGGLKTNITRDAAGRPTVMAYTHLAGRGNPGATDFRYDALGRITEASNAKSSVTQAYDTLSNPGSEAVQLGASPAVLLHRTYDYRGRLSEVDPPGVSNAVKFAYDNENKVTAIDRNVSTDVATIRYLGARPLVREYRNGATVLGKSTLGYEDTGLRPDSIDHLDRVNAVVDSSTYGWDDAYNLESVAITGGVLAASPESYDYDPLNRLDPDSPDFDPAWTYDDTGNRTGTGYTQTGQDADMHRYTTVDGNAMHYDAQGALVQAGIDADSIYEYVYDVAGRLVNFRDVTIAPSTAFDPLNLDDAGWNVPLSGTWSVNNNGTSGNASDDYLEETSGAIGAIFYEHNVSNGGMTFAYRSLHDPGNPDGDVQPGEFDGDDYPGKYYAQILFGVADDPGPPYGYLALRIEPDRLSFVTFDGTELKELDTVDAVTEANTWYTVRLGAVFGGPEGGTLLVERSSDAAGEPLIKLMQATSLTEIPPLLGPRIGFTVGAAAEYEFRLVEYANEPSTAETYIRWDYDAFGRKLAETRYEVSTEIEPTAQTRYVWDGWRLVSEINGLTGQPIAEYIPGPDYVDDVVASRRDLDSNGTFAADEIFYHQTNHQHSTVALLDHNGDVAERYSYDPFGVPTVHDATGDPIAQSAYGNTRLYTGLPWLPDLGLYDTRQRLYNPAAGRFLTQDPVHDPANLGNPYTYVGNNPGAYVDPYGLSMELANPGWFSWAGVFYSAFFESYASPTSTPKLESDPFQLLNEFENRAAQGDNTRGLGDAQHAAREAWESGRGAVNTGAMVGSFAPGAPGFLLSGALSFTDASKGNWSEAVLGGLPIVAGIHGFGAADDGSRTAGRQLELNLGEGLETQLELDLIERSAATLGRSTSTQYRKTFFDKHPELRGKVVVHHAIEQQVMTRYPGVISETELHSLENLRGIPHNANSTLHLREIRREWDNFYASHPSASKEQLLQKAGDIDRKYYKDFRP